jgi:hypothetical protein
MEPQKDITQGTITRTNNPRFTFPIKHMTDDYFVIISPLASVASVASACASSSSPPLNSLCDEDYAKQMPMSRFHTVQSSHKGIINETFAIFYPKRVLKERKRRCKKETVDFERVSADWDYVVNQGMTQKKVASDDSEFPQNTETQSQESFLETESNRCVRLPMKLNAKKI